MVGVTAGRTALRQKLTLGVVTVLCGYHCITPSCMIHAGAGRQGGSRQNKGHGQGASNEQTPLLGQEREEDEDRTGCCTIL